MQRRVISPYNHLIKDYGLCLILLGCVCRARFWLC